MDDFQGILTLYIYWLIFSRLFKWFNKNKNKNQKQIKMKGKQEAPRVTLPKAQEMYTSINEMDINSEREHHYENQIVTDIDAKPPLLNGICGCLSGVFLFLAVLFTCLAIYFYLA
jgi:hypothetical protein